MEISIVGDNYTNLIKSGMRLTQWKYDVQNIEHFNNKLIINDISFCTYETPISIIRDKLDNFNSDVKILWICEPYCINSMFYDQVKENKDKWNYILSQDYNENYHFVTFDFNSLSDILKEIGFNNIRKYDWKKTEHFDIDDFSKAYIPHKDFENGKLMSLNIEAIK